MIPDFCLVWWDIRYSDEWEVTTTGFKNTFWSDLKNDMSVSERSSVTFVVFENFQGFLRKLSHFCDFLRFRDIFLTLYRFLPAKHSHFQRTVRLMVPCRQAFKRSLERKRSSHQKRWTDPTGGPVVLGLVKIEKLEKWKVSPSDIQNLCKLELSKLNFLWKAISM